MKKHAACLRCLICRLAGPSSIRREYHDRDPADPLAAETVWEFLPDYQRLA